MAQEVVEAPVIPAYRGTAGPPAILEYQELQELLAFLAFLATVGSRATAVFQAGADILE